MNVWASQDRFAAISDAAERRVRSEAWVSSIADALAVAGEYVVRVDLQPTEGSSTSNGQPVKQDVGSTCESTRS